MREALIAGILLLLLTGAVYRSFENVRLQNRSVCTEYVRDYSNPFSELPIKCVSYKLSN